MDANNKYGIPAPYCYEINVSSEGYSDSEIDDAAWRIFLMVTDHIPNKILEQLIENLADATAITFVSVFIGFIKDVRLTYKNVLSLRKTAREEINRLEGEAESETETEGGEI